MDGTMLETATINGTELAYLEHGQGQPVVFVHGGVGDYREWNLQVPAFAASFRTITLKPPVAPGPTGSSRRTRT